tara:strand:+ start:328 stop:1293 length:966 start_codon:yes stop_codon:yes gene_type:complete
MGPTASGKTDLAVALCQHLPCDIISVDSALVYRDMNIGSAKPKTGVLAQAPHRLINIRDASQPYSVAEFVSDALEQINSISGAGRIPLLVGGTMLYFKALFEGIATMPSADKKVRAELEREASQYGWPSIHKRLAAVDPAMAGKIHPNHSQRLSRALEVFLISGVTMSEWRRRQAEEKNKALSASYQIVQIAISTARRSELHQKISLRFDQMLEQGFLDEVKALRTRTNLHTKLPSIRAAGYRQAWAYLQGDYDFETFREKSISATRQLAKRQLTWLRGWQDLQWIYTDTEDNACADMNMTGTIYTEPKQLALKYINTVII